MARTFFRMVFRKFSEITKSKPIFSQYNIFYNYEYFFFQSAFWSLFNHRQRSQSNQEQCGMCCSSPCFLALLCTHYGPLQCFSTYFCKLKEIGVLRPVFPLLFLVTMFIRSFNKSFYIRQVFSTSISVFHDWLLTKFVFT